MRYENVLMKYEDELQNAEFEILKTPRLGWILLMTDFLHYSDPIRQFFSPQEMEECLNVRLRNGGK